MNADMEAVGGMRNYQGRRHVPDRQGLFYAVPCASASAFFTANNSFNTPRSFVDSSAFAPSDFASFGLSWTSMNTPSTPAATAARAKRGMNSGCPPLTAGPPSDDWDDGNCTE